MGPSQTHEKVQRQNAEGQKLVINHPRYQNLKVVSAPSEDDEGVIQITIPLPNQNQFKKWQKKLAEVSQSDNIFLPLRQKFQKTEFCGSGGVATIAYKYYPYLLSDQVVNRCNMESKYFQENQLWYLVYSIILAGDSFHSSGRKIGDVRPQNVFISPEGQVRVATQYTWPGQSTNYIKTVFEKEVTYLSPEELKDIGYGKLQEPTNYSLNESFSIGLTCLDAASLTDSTKLYQANNKFNYNALEQRLSSLQKSGIYTEALTLLIKGLCQVEESKRVTCKQLASWLSKYQQSIIELQEFRVAQIPQKLTRLNPRDSKVQGVYGQYQSQIQPLPNTANYITAPVNRSQIRYGEQNVIKPQTYTNQVPYQQYTYQQFNPIYGNSNGIGQPVLQGSNSNNNPSLITFQKDTNLRSVIGDQSVNSQLRSASLNLQQIDEQLQMSRKLFPS